MLVLARPSMRLVWRGALGTFVTAALLATAPAQAAKQFQVVVFGDSFAAGEGGPAADGDYGASGEDIGHLLAERQPARLRANWSGSDADTRFTADTKDGKLSAERCHRSPRATAPEAVRQLQREFPDIGFTFRSFACSGARIDEGPLGTFEGAEPIDERASFRVPSQISQANTYLNDERPADTDRRIDALVMGIGGNNLGFGNLIERCMNIGPAFPFNPCNPRSFGGLGNDDALKVFEAGEGSGEAPHLIGLDNLAGLYGLLHERINTNAGKSGQPADTLAVKPAKIYLTGPPNPIAGTFDGCGTGANDYEKNLQLSERTWLQQDILPRMIAAMRFHAHAQQPSWKFVDMLGSTSANGLCSGAGRMFNTNRDALRAQGATIVSQLNIAVSHGIAHPNRRGYSAMAPRLAAALRPQVLQEFTPPAPLAGAPEPVTALLPRVTMRLTASTADYPTRPAAVSIDRPPGARPTHTGPLSEGSGLVDLPTPSDADTIDRLSVFTTRCGPVPPPGACAYPFREVTNVLVGTPGVPTAVSARAATGGVAIEWAKGSPPTRTLRRFLAVARSRFDNTRETTTLEFSLGADLREALLPLPRGSWTVQVRECTDRGCAVPSPAVVVNSSGPQAFFSSPMPAAPRQFTPQIDAGPAGVFTMPAGLRARAGKAFGLKVLWATWTHWRHLKTMRIRLLGDRGELGTLRIALRSGRVTLDGPGARRRYGRIGRSGQLRARRIALDTARARILGGGRRSRLVTLELPLKLSRTLARQRVYVSVAADTRTGRKQGFGPAGSFAIDTRRRAR